MNPATHPLPRYDDPLDDVARRPTAPVLSGYFYGQMLAEDGLRREQLWIRGRQALLARLLGGAEGVLEGLTLGSEGDSTIAVSPGVAIDAVGRLIVVPDPETPNPLNQGGKSGPAWLRLPAALLGVEPPGEGRTADYDVVLLPDLEPVEQAPVLACDDDGGPPVSEYEVSAYREGYRLYLRKPDPARAPAFPAEPGPAFPADPRPDFSAGRPALLADDHRSESTPLRPDGVLLGRVSIAQAGAGDGATYRLRGAAPGARRDVPSLADLGATCLRMAARLDDCLRSAAMLDDRLRRRSLAVAGGNGQAGPCGTPLPVPIAVIALDPLGRPAPGTRVIFHVVAGGGGASARENVWGTTALAEADAEGMAAMRWRLGVRPGFHSVEARIVTEAGITAPECVTFVAWCEPPGPEPARPNDPPPDDRVTPARPAPGAHPDPVRPPPATGPDPARPAPRVVGMNPWGALGPRDVQAWKTTRTLRLQFDQPMLRDDLAEPAGWLRVFLVRRRWGDRGLGRVVLTALPVSCAGEPSESAAEYLVGPIPNAPGTLPQAYVLVLIGDPAQSPRSASGIGLASRFAGTTLDDDVARQVAGLTLAPGETSEESIEWPDFAPKAGAALPSGAGGGEGALFHASFLLGEWDDRPADDPAGH